MTPLQERFKEAIEKQDLTITHELGGIHIAKLSPVEIHAAAIACEKIAEEFAKALAEWMDDNGCTKFNGGWASILDTEKSYTINELLQQFKEGRK